MMIRENIGAFITLSFGLLGLLQPKKAAKLTSIAPIGRNGISEIRATYGGLFSGMGCWCLIAQSEAVFCAAGIAWLGAALGRAISALFDRNFDCKNIGGFFLESSIGILLTSSFIDVWFWSTF